MGLTHIDGTVTGPAGKEATLKFLVDSGATYTVLPYKIWRAIRLKGTDTVTCTLVDGTEVKRKVSDCHITLPQGRRQTPVILGEKDDEALLGVVTLEEFRLILNPFNRKLHPSRCCPSAQKAREHPGASFSTSVASASPSPGGEGRGEGEPPSDPLILPGREGQG